MKLTHSSAWWLGRPAKEKFVWVCCSWGEATSCCPRSWGHDWQLRYCRQPAHCIKKGNEDHGDWRRKTSHSCDNRQSHHYAIFLLKISGILLLGSRKCCLADFVMYWLSIIQTFPCFLHSLNTLIGEICSFPLMKQTILKSTCIMNFFNSSHYWGGQLNGEAKKQGINWKMKQNCKSRFYAFILQSMSVLAYQ